MQVFKSTVALLLGTIPGFIYWWTDMVGIGGTIFLMVVGGFIGLALSLPRVSTRRVIAMGGQATPLLWPIAAIVGPPETEAQEAEVPPINDIPKPSLLDPNWCTPDVLALARAIRFESRTDLLPILGDALIEAGCEDNKILEHCRNGSATMPIMEMLVHLLSHPCSKQ